MSPCYNGGPGAGFRVCRTAGRSGGRRGVSLIASRQAGISRRVIGPLEQMTSVHARISHSGGSLVLCVGIIPLSHWLALTCAVVYRVSALSVEWSLDTKLKQAFQFGDGVSAPAI